MYQQKGTRPATKQDIDRAAYRLTSSIYRSEGQDRKAQWLRVFTKLAHDWAKDEQIVRTAKEREQVEMMLTAVIKDAIGNDKSELRPPTTE